MIFNIQRFSTHDGNGIRTIIFYKGCPLKCQWCSNPESQSFGFSIMYDQRLCKNFGDCKKAEPDAISLINDRVVSIDRRKISSGNKLSGICPSKAMTVSGDDKSVEELIAEIEKDRVFYGQEGGVTLSGGEPLAQGKELDDLLAGLKARNISVNIETSLHVNWQNVERCIGLADTFLVDLKHTDRDKFYTYTGGDTGLVLENIEMLSRKNAHVIIRIPVIPLFNHSESEMEQIIDFVSTLKNIKEIDFLPYHTFGLGKYKMLDMEYQFGSKQQVQDSELTEYIQYAKSKGFKVNIGG
jgi:pyruvate formate lyase activating enzyme